MTVDEVLARAAKEGYPVTYANGKVYVNGQTGKSVEMPENLRLMLGTYKRVILAHFKDEPTSLFETELLKVAELEMSSRCACGKSATILRISGKWECDACTDLPGNGPDPRATPAEEVAFPEDPLLAHLAGAVEAVRQKIYEETEAAIRSRETENWEQREAHLKRQRDLLRVDYAQAYRAWRARHDNLRASATR